jgi:hypothetical protein
MKGQDATMACHGQRLRALPRSRELLPNRNQRRKNYPFFKNSSHREQLQLANRFPPLKL